MKTKLNIFGEDVIWTQSPHGEYQGGKAMDSKRGFLEADINSYEVRAVNYQVPRHQTWFDLHIPVISGYAFYRIVHAEPLKMGTFKKGERIAKSIYYTDKNGWDNSHFHVALNINGKWFEPAAAIPKTVPMYWVNKPGKHKIWTNHATYPDVYLDIKSDIIEEMVQLQKPIQVQVTGVSEGKTLLVRPEPNTNKAATGKLKHNEKFSTKKIARGQNIDGVNTWYYFSGSTVKGYVSGKFIKELGINSEQEERIRQLEEKMKDYDKKVAQWENTKQDLERALQQKAEAFSGLERNNQQLKIEKEELLETIGMLQKQIGELDDQLKDANRISLLYNKLINTIKKWLLRKKQSK